MPFAHKTIAYIVNADWYFVLHWLARARAARDRGLSVHVLTALTDARHQRTLAEHGLVCHPISLDRKGMNPLTEIASLRQIHAILRALNPDLVHCITVKPNILGGLATRRLGIKTILNVTGLGLAFSGRTGRAIIARQFVRPFYRLAANRPDCRIVFENQDDSERFSRLGIGWPGSHVVIPGSGVDTQVFAWTEEPDCQEPVVLFAGRLLRDKGLADLVAAGDILRRRGLRFRLDVAGIVDEKSQNAIPLSQIEGWHAEGRINWLGTRHDMPAVLAGATIVALPSFYGEGVPRVLIEAAAVGRALVATSISGCRDIVRHGENGLLVRPNRPDELADALETLLRDRQLRQRFALAGRRLVEDVFGQDRVIAAMNAVYVAMLGEV